MEEQKKDKGTNYATWIVVAIIACIFIGIRVYTKYLNQKNMETLSRIIEKNPDVLNQRNNGNNTDYKIIWKTYSDDVFSFNYPGTYGVRKDMSGDMVQIFCEANDNGEYAVVNITYIGGFDLESISTSEKKQRCINGIKAAQESMEKELKASFSPITRGEIGNLNGYLTTFEGNLYGLYEIEGNIFMNFYQDKTIIIASQAEKGKSIEKVNKIIESIKVK